MRRRLCTRCRRIVVDPAIEAAVKVVEAGDKIRIVGERPFCRWVIHW
jgi:hypothetical protein